MFIFTSIYFQEKNNKHQTTLLYLVLCIFNLTVLGRRWRQSDDAEMSDSSLRLFHEPVNTNISSAQIIHVLPQVAAHCDLDKLRKSPCGVACAASSHGDTLV